MKIEPLDIEGAWTITPVIHGDRRGRFLEVFRSSAFELAVGHRFDLQQTNCSISARGVVRGIHFADVPPGQAKYVTCVSGRILDVIVDIRMGSRTFGQWTSVVLDEDERRSVYISEGLGHGFASLAADSTVIYLCSRSYNPSGEHEVHPMDPALGIDWGLPADEIQLSDKDAAAPTLADATESRLLPRHDVCQGFRQGLARPTGRQPDPTG